MTRGENRDLTRDIIVRVSPARNTLIVEEQKPVSYTHLTLPTKLVV